MLPVQDFEELFHSARNDLRRFLSRRVACPHTVSDLMQEAFLKLMGAPPATDIRDPRAYLFRIAANIAINHGRSSRETLLPACAPTLSDERSLEIVDERTPERVLDGNRQLQRVMEAIESLPPRCKEVFVLYRFHNLSQANIAEKLGISPSMVEKHVIRAMRNCRDARDQAT